MSADNNICIMEWGDEWFVWHGSMSADYIEPESYSNGFLTEKEASEFAHQLYDEIGYVEGGIIHIGKEQQEDALISIISSLIGRLHRLRTTGSQLNTLDHERK
jgi:hypothetical protein